MFEKDNYTLEDFSKYMTKTELAKIKKQGTLFRKQSWFSFVKKISGQFVLLTYVTKCNSSTKNTCLLELADIRTFNEHYVSNKIFFNYLAGYRYVFDSEATAYIKDPLFCVNIYSTLMNEKQLIKWLRKEDKYKYVDLESLFSCDGISSFNYLKTLTEHPYEVEMLQKTGNSGLISYKQVYKMPFKKLQKKIELGKKYNCSPFDNTVIKFNETYSKRYNRVFSGYEIRKLQRIKKYCEFTEYQDCLRAIQYVEEQHSSIYEFENYIHTRHRCNLDCTDYGAKFPRDFHLAYRQVQDVLEAIKAEEEEKRKEAERLETAEMDRKLNRCRVNVEVKSRTYSVYQPQKTSDFVALGNVMHNCVGSMGYHRRTAEKKCLIFGIKKNNTMYACLEVKPGKDKEPVINQLYLEHNKQCDEETRLFVITEILPQLATYFKTNIQPRPVA